MSTSESLKQFNIIIKRYLTKLNSSMYYALDGSKKSLGDMDKHEFMMEMKKLREVLKTVKKDAEFNDLITQTFLRIEEITYDEVFVIFKYLDEIIFNLDKQDGILVTETKLDQSFWSELHPKISKWAKSRYETKHYADAAESVFKGINSIVKYIVKKKINEELDGATLMQTAFSPKQPIILLDDLSTESGRNVQLGYMQIFAGAMTGIRNPKAHENIIIEERKCKHFLFLGSLLMLKIDETGEEYEKA
jgi:uncharacterized protein (TIGR02391 family)